MYALPKLLLHFYTPSAQFLGQALVTTPRFEPDVMCELVGNLRFSDSIPPQLESSILPVLPESNIPLEIRVVQVLP